MLSTPELRGLVVEFEAMTDNGPFKSVWYLEQVVQKCRTTERMLFFLNDTMAALKRVMLIIYSS